MKHNTNDARTAERLPDGKHTSSWYSVYLWTTRMFSLSYFVYKQWCFCFSCYLLLVFIFFSACSFSSVGDLRGVGRQIVFFTISFIFFFLSCDLSSFLFSLQLFPFVSLFHRMCMSCLSYLSIVWWHDIALPTVVLTACLVRGYVVSLRRSFVTTEVVYRLGLKNRHGHCLCWMSTGRKNGLMCRTHTHSIVSLWGIFVVTYFEFL